MRKTWLILAIVFLAAFGGNVALAQIPDPLPPPKGRVSSPSDLASEFAKTVGISTEEALKAFSDSGPILDFKTNFQDDDRFGSIWVEYSPKYSIHLRVASGAMDKESRLLTKQVSNQPVLHFGGPNLKTLNEIKKRFDKQNIGYFLDDKVGVFRVWEPVPETDARYTQVMAKPEFEDHWAGAGLTLWNYRYDTGWTKQCGTAFVWRSPSSTGLGSAAHCMWPIPVFNGQASNFYTTGGEYSSTLTTVGCDYQTRAHDNGSSVVTYDWASNQYAYISVHAVALGYYTNQPVFKMGSSFNPAANTNWGVVNGWSSTPTFGYDYCNGANFTGLWYSNYSSPGDSGGPIYLLYQNLFHLAAIHKGASPAGDARGKFVNDVPLPPGAHVCTSSNPC
jgi:hypothetical protein